MRKKLVIKSFFELKKQSLVWLLVLAWFPAFSQNQTSDISNFYPFLKNYTATGNAKLSYMAKDWRNTEKWRKTAKAKLHELLAFHPTPAPLNTEILSTTKRQGYTQFLVRYNVNALQKTEAFF